MAEPKTGRRFYYLALSYGYVQPDMSDTPEGKKSRDAAYSRVTTVLGRLRRVGRLDWSAVLDLTRELVNWQTYDSLRAVRARMRRTYDEDRWLGQRTYPILIVEKDTMEPGCRPMASAWQMPFASSRGYGSLTLQHDVAEALDRRHARTGQMARIYFASDLDPSGLDLQRSWQEAVHNFGVLHTFARIALTGEQVRDNVDIRGLPLQRLAIGVKASDCRSASYLAMHGGRCWEVDILPTEIIKRALDSDVRSWLDREQWKRRASEIERARALL